MKKTVRIDVLEYLRTRPFHEVESFRDWYLEYHRIPSNWKVETLPSERIRRELDSILDIMIERAKAIKFDSNE